jgi:hypothetical protein
MSHYSDDEVFYENDLISGTMEGLVDGSMFDIEHADSAYREPNKRQMTQEYDTNYEHAQSADYQKRQFQEFGQPLELQEVDNNLTELKLNSEPQSDPSQIENPISDAPTNDLTKGTSNENDQSDCRK